MDIRLTNVVKSVSEIQGEIGEIRSMLGQILKNMSIQSGKINREHAETTLKGGIRIQGKQDSGDDRAANIDFAVNKDENPTRNPGKNKIGEACFQEIRMKTNQIQETCIKQDSYHKNTFGENLQCKIPTLQVKEIIITILFVVEWDWIKGDTTFIKKIWSTRWRLIFLALTAEWIRKNSLDWALEVENFFEYANILDDKKIKLVAFKFQKVLRLGGTN